MPVSFSGMPNTEPGQTLAQRKHCLVRIAQVNCDFFDFSAVSNADNTLSHRNIAIADIRLRRPDKKGLDRVKPFRRLAQQPFYFR